MKTDPPLWRGSHGKESRQARALDTGGRDAELRGGGAGVCPEEVGLGDEADRSGAGDGPEHGEGVAGGWSGATLRGAEPDCGAGCAPGLDARAVAGRGSEWGCVPAGAFGEGRPGKSPYGGAGAVSPASGAGGS